MSDKRKYSRENGNYGNNYGGNYRTNVVKNQQDGEWLRVTNKAREKKAPVMSHMIMVQTIYPGYRHWIRLYRGNVYKNNDNGEDIYHWHLESHNFFDIEDNRKSSKEKRVYLAFTEPDYEIVIMDKTPKYGVDQYYEVGFRPILYYARWKQIKFKPNSFIAKNVEQIEEALKHIKYCMVENLVDNDLEGDLDQSFLEKDDKKDLQVKMQVACTPHMPSIFSSNNYLSNFDIDSSQKNVGKVDREENSLQIVYPSVPPHKNILEDMQSDRELSLKQKIDIMGSSPLGCLESPKYFN